MLVQCFAENGDMVGVVTKNKAYFLIRKHFAVVVNVDVDNVLRNNLVAIKLKQALPVEELTKKNWR